ncbi:MAG: hypothetical protein H6733_04285, partial [Alphaproteobacteria bacterium]|nr:hypothetical protein [Alphaproteobacteria bacterium]
MPARLLLIALLVGCAGGTDVDAVDTDSDTPAPTTEDRVATYAADGPHYVASTVWTVTYADPASGADRSLRVTAWYPTPVNDSPRVRFTGPHAATDVQDDVAPATGPWPLILFSHGHQGNMDNVSHLMRHFATHGWVAVAPEHTGNTLADGDNRDTEIYVQRSYDVSAVLDDVLGDDDRFGGLDGRVFGTGHSFGGYTVFTLAGASWDVDYWDTACTDGSTDAFCSTWSTDLADLMRAGAADDRIAAFASLSGGNWGQIRETGFATLDMPLMQFSGGLDGSVTNEGSSDPIWRDLAAGDKVRVDIAHGDHQ